MSCPTDALSGLVDGELDHAPRERVLSHVMACATCQAEVAALRRLKTQLSWAGAETPTPAPELAGRLLQVAVAAGPDRPAHRPRSRQRREDRALAGRRPPGSAPTTRRLRRRAVGSLVALGLGAAFLLGGPSSAGGPRAPIDPATDQFVTDYVNATVEVPVTEPVSASVVGSAR